MDLSTNQEDRMEKGEILMSAGEEVIGLGDSQDPISSECSAPNVEATEASEKISHNKILRFWSAIRKSRDPRPEPALKPRKPVVRSCTCPINRFTSSPTADSPPVEQCPAGYPRLAAFLSSDENFMLYRRFDYLQARLLLYKQDELRELEGELDHLDAIDENEDPSL
jgi:hypothetical protein